MIGKMAQIGVQAYDARSRTARSQRDHTHTTAGRARCIPLDLIPTKVVIASAAIYTTVY